MGVLLLILPKMLEPFTDSSKHGFGIHLFLFGVPHLAEEFTQHVGQRLIFLVQISQLARNER